MIGPRLLYTYFKFVYLTSKKNFHIKETTPDTPVVFVFWHGNLIMLPFLYAKLRKIKRAKVLISEHFDGRVVAGYNELVGLETIAGSSTRGAVRVLMQSLKAIKNGYDIGITPDGPKGPRFHISDGAAVIAQKTKVPMMAYTCKPSKFWQVSSWDKTIIPKPFGVLDFYASALFSVENLDLDAAKVRIKEELMILEGEDDEK